MKKVLNILLVTLFFMGLIVGSTYSYFTSGTNASDVNFTLGSLDVEITNQPDSNSLNEWDEGEDNAKALSWTFKNTGSKMAFIRAKIDSFWEIPDNGEDCGGSAWAGKTIGTTPSAVGYHGQGNTFRYFKFDPEETSTSRDLALGNAQETVGNLSVEILPVLNGDGGDNDDGSKLIRFEVDIQDGFEAEDVHLHISNFKDVYEESTSPFSPGSFDYGKEEFSDEGSYYYIEIDSDDVAPDLDLSEKMYIAFHTSLDCKSETESSEPSIKQGDENTNWAVTNSNKWQQGSDGYWYYSDILGAGEEIDLEFTIEMLSLDGYKDAKYFIDLTLDALQTTNNSLDYNWPDWPYN